MTTDQIYTPGDLAIEMLSCASISPKLVADFAMGGGALLKAARDRWPGTAVLGNDVEVDSVVLPGGPLDHGPFAGDFLAWEQFAPGLSEFLSRVDLILLNPPFSVRGSQKWSHELDGRPLTSSRALSFLIRSVPFLTENGEIVAVLPTSCTRSERDAEAMRHLNTRFNITVEVAGLRKRFAGHSVSVDLIKLTRRAKAVRPSIIPPPVGEPTAKLRRGTLSVHDAITSQPRAGVRYIHTTDLSSTGLAQAERWVSNSGCRTFSGSNLLIPRVGRPTLSKLSVVEFQEAAVLSDCIIACEARDAPGLHEIYKCIQLEWKKFSLLYSASCAPYITLRQIREFLGSHGLIVDI